MNQTRRRIFQVTLDTQMVKMDEWIRLDLEPGSPGNVISGELFVNVMERRAVTNPAPFPS